MKILFKGAKPKRENIGHCKWCHTLFQITRKKDVSGYTNDDIWARCPTCNMEIRFESGDYKIDNFK